MSAHHELTSGAHLHLQLLFATAPPSAPRGNATCAAAIVDGHVQPRRARRCDHAGSISDPTIDRETRQLAAIRLRSGFASVRLQRPTDPVSDPAMEPVMLKLNST
jgi:hypothetical protein